MLGQIVLIVLALVLVTKLLTARHKVYLAQRIAEVINARHAELKKVLQYQEERNRELATADDEEEKE
jgi:hypothetical protein